MSVGIIAGNVRAMWGVTVQFNPASTPANDTTNQVITVPGVRTTDIVVLNRFPATAATGLIVANPVVLADNQVTVTFANVTASPIDPGATEFRFMIFRVEGNRYLPGTGNG